MAIKFISVKCPNCGASFPIEEGRNQFYCAYCGTHIIINNENEYIYRHIDEAAIKKDETERLIELKRLELEEKRMHAREKKKRTRMTLSILLVIFAILFIYSGFRGNGHIGTAIPGFICIYVLMEIWEKKDENEE